MESFQPHTISHVRFNPIRSANALQTHSIGPPPITIRLHGTRRNKIPFKPMRKVRNLLPRFSRNPKTQKHCVQKFYRISIKLNSTVRKNSYWIKGSMSMGAKILILIQKLMRKVCKSLNEYERSSSLFANISYCNSKAKKPHCKNSYQNSTTQQNCVQKCCTWLNHNPKFLK
jgi:hypothetical protein